MYQRLCEGVGTTQEVQQGLFSFITARELLDKTYFCSDTVFLFQDLIGETSCVRTS